MKGLQRDWQRRQKARIGPRNKGATLMWQGDWQDRAVRWAGWGEQEDDAHRRAGRRAVRNDWRAEQRRFHELRQRKMEPAATEQSLCCLPSSSPCQLAAAAATCCPPKGLGVPAAADDPWGTPCSPSPLPPCPPHTRGPEEGTSTGRGLEGAPWERAAQAEDSKAGRGRQNLLQVAALSFTIHSTLLTEC